MKRITVLILLSILASCATVRSIDSVIENAAWDTAAILEETTDKTVAVYYFTSSDKDDQELSEYLRQGLTTEIANAVSYEELNIKVISRQILDQIMEEQSFQLSDLVDESTQSEVGKLLGADLIISGQINWVDDETCHIDIQIIEVGTSIVLGGFSYNFWVDDE